MRSSIVLTATFSVVLTGVGCSSTPDVPPLENGWHVDAVNARQRDAAAADQRVVYRYEWATDDQPTRLTDYGRRHLIQVAQSVATTRRPIVVEPAEDPAVDEARRRLVVAMLADLAVPDPAALVRVQRPTAYGTNGDEAANVDADTPRGGQSNGTSGGNSLGGGSSGQSSAGLGGGRSGGY